MPSKDERRKQLEAELAELDKPDPDENFEIEIGEGDKFARVPYSKGRSWLQKTFGIDMGEEPADDEGEGEAPKPDEEPGKVQRFGRRVG